MPDAVLRTQATVLFSKNSQPVWWADGRLPVSDFSVLPGQGHSTGWDELSAHLAEDGFAGGAGLKCIHNESRVIQTQAEWQVQALLVLGSERLHCPKLALTCQIPSLMCQAKISFSQEKGQRCHPCQLRGCSSHLKLGRLRRQGRMRWQDEQGTGPVFCHRWSGHHQTRPRRLPSAGRPEPDKPTLDRVELNHRTAFLSLSKKQTKSPEEENHLIFLISLQTALGTCET